MCAVRSTLLVLVGVMLVLTGVAPTAGAVQRRRESGCRQTKVTGTVDNETGVRMTLVDDVHGRGQAWCANPSHTVAAHASGTIGIVGDDAGGTSVRITYRLKTGDEVEFDAILSRPLVREQTGCSFEQPARMSKRYECEATVTGKTVTKDEHVVFTVKPLTGPSVSGATPPRVGATSGCGTAASAIYGSTINHTNQPITLEGLEKGPTNEWCTLPMLDQTPPGATNNWKLGDNVFGTALTLWYSVPSSEPYGDWFQFFANVNFIFGGGTATCAPYVDAEHPSSGKYACKATWTQGFNSHYPSVTFQILPGTQSAVGLTVAEHGGR
jgi:hypothetical protein